MLPKQNAILVGHSLGSGHLQFPVNLLQWHILADWAKKYNRLGITKTNFGGFGDRLGSFCQECSLFFIFRRLKAKLFNISVIYILGQWWSFIRRLGLLVNSLFFLLKKASFGLVVAFIGLGLSWRLYCVAWGCKFSYGYSLKQVSVFLIPIGKSRSSFYRNF